ncbi:cobaltochelatase subunit CobN [Caulobacter sp.]|uniref:cobaltochelatase subunit CobN n=1 Tax=Caulobacter sp. TaxID=78 RepID=UPI001B1527C1|nr:cobaltochelatase subunit CobN [Caulobacter sp.]MBO9545425.1 cobaltochelatase subunit CobN [Caulobacter sp.]
MIRRLLLGLLTLLVFAAPAAAQERPLRVAVVSIELAANPGLAQAAARRVAGEMTVDLYGLGKGLLPSVEDADLAAYDLVIVEGVGPQLLGYAAKFDAARARTKLVVVNGERWIKGNVDPATLPDLQAYWTNATEENYVRLLGYLKVRVLGRPGQIAPPIVYPETAFYHPQATGPFQTLGAYETWERQRLPDGDKRPRIAILFYRSVVLARNAGVVDALIAEVERQGGLPIPLWRKDSAASLRLLGAGGADAPDALILCGSWIDYQDHAAGAAAAKALGSVILGCNTDYARTPAQWAASPAGMAPSGQLAMSELEGLIEPMTVGAREIDASGAAVMTPIPEQIEWRVARAMRWARLKRLANTEKRLVIPYYSEARDTADVGSDPDSYLDAQGSLVVLLRRLKAEGYDVGAEPLPDRDQLSALLRDRGSNPKTAAELTSRVRDGSVALVPEADYRAWWGALPKAARDAQVAQWGPPPGDLMVHTDNQGRRFLAIPVLKFGKIALAPHPIWGMQEARGLAAQGALTPHHQYAAFYFWAREVWKADALLPLFTQISLMPGKQEGPAATDWIGLLVGDLPHIQPTPLQANGGVSNKRRANALTIGFMPELVRAGLAPELAVLKRQVAASDEASARKAAGQLGLGAPLGLDPATAPWSALRPALEAYLDEIARAPAPQGGHVLGVAPSDAVTARIVQAMVDGPDLPTVEAVLAGRPGDLPPDQQARILDYADRVRAAPRELDAVIDALAGRFVTPGPNADALRNPDALPAGRNPYTLDTRALPSPQAWATGARLADEMVAAYRSRHGGAAPRKAAFVLWSGETALNGGVMEAQILRLLGVRPVWNPKGQVVDVALDDRGALGRGRIDVLVTTSGTYRDHFGDKIALLAKAVRLAAAADEPDNAVRVAVSATRASLLTQGVSPAEADKRALRRIFSTAPGAFSPTTEFAAKADPAWSDTQIAAHYAQRLGHAYDGGQEDGAADGAAFADNLKTVDAAVFSRSSSAYGLLDTPMPAAYFGGLAMAVRQETGRRIETYVANLQSPQAARIETADRTLNRELRSRYFNPDWIKAMQAGGYNGARYLSEFTENVRLWEITDPRLVKDRDWNEVADVYVRDRYGLGLREYFARSNPQAYQNLVRTLVETAEQGRWKADRATLSALKRELAGAAPGPAPSGRPTAAAAAPAAKPALNGLEIETVATRVLSATPPPAAAAPSWTFLVVLLLGLIGLGGMIEPGPGRRLHNA